MKIEHSINIQGLLFITHNHSPTDKKIATNCSWKHSSRPLSLQLYQKETPAQDFSYEFGEIFKYIYFVEHLQMTASEEWIKWCLYKSDMQWRGHLPQTDTFYEPTKS